MKCCDKTKKGSEIYCWYNLESIYCTVQKLGGGGGDSPPAGTAPCGIPDEGGC